MSDPIRRSALRMARMAMMAALPVVLVPAGLLASARPQVSASPEIHEVTVTVGDKTVSALCTGGPRRAVLWHGRDASAEVWRPVLERIDDSFGACAFDRVGSGRSGPAPGPRGWYELVDELRRIHLALGIERDYVLVGHDLGGLYARVYAADRPGDVAGLLLVEPDHEALPARLRGWMPDREWRLWRERRTRPNADGLAQVRVEARARSTRVPSLPVTVVTARIRPVGPGWEPRFVNEITREVHGSTLQGSPMGRHVPASRSTHDVPGDQPALIAAEIRRLVRATTLRGS